MKNIKIGTLASANVSKAKTYFPKLKEYGFESIGLNYDLSANVDKESFKSTAIELKALADEYDLEISMAGLYANPLEDSEDGNAARNIWHLLIENANIFNTDLICGFAGRVPNVPVDESMPKFKEVFSGILDNAKANGIRIAFENCPMGGDWNKGSYNIAFNPLAWEMIFNMFPNHNIGLEWEPTHQMCQLIDPMAQLKKIAAAKKVYHIHGKDCSLDWDVIKEYGIYTNKPFAYHRTPGFGDCNWTDIISILRINEYEGNIDIEGYHDPIYRGDWEFTGQIHGLNYLKNCRGGSFVENPEGIF